MSGRHGRALVSASVLNGSPEIAVLDGLGHTLRIAIAVTRALNPELTTPWSGACRLRVKAATLVITHAESLLSALADYRDIVNCESCFHGEDDEDDLPFWNPFRWVRRPTPGSYPESFDFLGFTFYWGQGRWTRARVGRWMVKTKTARKSLTRALSAVRAWIRRHRHRPVRWQWEELQKKGLGRRSHKAHGTWAWMRELLTRYPLPKPPTAQSRSECMT